MQIYPGTKEYSWFARHQWETIDVEDFYNNFSKNKYVKLSEPDEAIKLLYCKKCKGRADITYMNTIPGEELMYIQTDIPMLSCEDVVIKNIIE